MNEVADWFSREILPHDAVIKQYLRRRGWQRADAEDLSQEVYFRVLTLAADARPISGKAYVLVVARHLELDLRRNGWKRFVQLTGNENPEGVIDELGPERHALAAAALEALQKGLDALTPRRRDVVLMRRVEGQSVKEIAQRLRLGQKTVEQHLTNALRLLRLPT